jgi:hypothetical protein
MMRLVRSCAAAVLAALGWGGLAGAAEYAPPACWPDDALPALDAGPPIPFFSPYHQIFWTMPPALTARSVLDRLAAQGVPLVPPPALFLGKEAPEPKKKDKPKKKAPDDKPEANKDDK